MKRLKTAILNRLQNCLENKEKMRTNAYMVIAARVEYAQCVIMSENENLSSGQTKKIPTAEAMTLENTRNRSYKDLTMSITLEST